MPISDVIYKIINKAVRPILKRPSIMNSLNYNRFENIFRLTMKYIVSNKIEGDYLEFGVYQGESFTTAYRFAKIFGLTKMKFIAFDAFQGLPEFSGVDKEGHHRYDEGEFSCSLEDFKKNICENGVDPARVKIVKGWYDKILNEKTKKKLKIKKAAAIMIDCDLYASTVPVLDFVVDYLQEGTVIMFDDWFSYRANPNRGEQKAFNEWLKKNPTIKVTVYNRFGPEGNSFIVIRAPK